MNEFMAIATSYPTNVFSIALIVVCMFWLFAIVGVADIELFDFDFDINAETDASGLGPLAGLLLKFGLHGIPVTIVLSVLVLLSWLLCFFASSYVLALLPAGTIRYIGGTAIVVACLFIAFPVTAMSLKPTKDLFQGATAARNTDIIGQPCEVRSLEVTLDFGQGEVADSGAGLLIDIRADVPNKISRGDIVAITGYDSANNTYTVIPETDFMNL